MLLDRISLYLYQNREFLIILDAIIIGLAVFWQLYLILEIDKKYHSRNFVGLLPSFIAFFIPKIIPNRAIIPFLFGIFIIIGTAAYNYFEYHDHYNFSKILISNLMLAGLFMLVIVLKSWLGPLMLAISIAAVLHQLSHLPFYTGGVEFMPDFIQDMIEPIFDRLPKSIYVVYTFVSLGYAFVGSVFDTMNN